MVSVLSQLKRIATDCETSSKATVQARETRAQQFQVASSISNPNAFQNPARASENLGNNQSGLPRRGCPQRRQPTRRQCIRETGPVGINLGTSRLSFPVESPQSMVEYKPDRFSAYAVEILDALQLIRSLPSPDTSQYASCTKNLPPNPVKKTVVLDLDETLVHCSENGNIRLIIRWPSGEVKSVGIQVRPYAFELLDHLAENFEVVVFTAGIKEYADAVLDFLDPTSTRVHHRLYRDDCVHIDGLHIKDLRRLNRPLEKIVLVDNEITSFAYQIDNGVPVLPWTGDPTDTELSGLLRYLNALLDVEDVRILNKLQFQLDSALRM